MHLAKVNFNDCIGADFFGGGITEQFVRYAIEGPNTFDPGITPVYPEAVELHFFNCPGGEVYEGYAIYTYLRTLATQGVKITAHVHGLCASIASVIVLAADVRLIGPLGQIMTHKPMCDVGPWANADDHAKAALELNALQGQIAAVYALRTGQPLDVLHGLMNDETFLYPADALALGFATGLLSEAPQEPAQEVARKVLNYARPPLTLTPAAMAITPAEETRLVDRFINAAKEFFAPKNEAPAPAPAPVNAATGFPATDDTGAAITLYADGSDLAVDAAVFTDEALSIAAADGNYTLEDGREITVLAGVVSEMEATDAAETAAAAAALAATNTAATDALSAEVAELKNQLATATNQVKSLKATVAKTVPGSTGNPTPAGTQTITNKVGGTTTTAAFTIRKV